MHVPIILSTLAAVVLAAPLAPRSAPDAIVKNHCPFPIWVTSVSPSGPQDNPKEVPGNAVWTEPEYNQNGGTAIKITRTADGLYTGAPVLTLGYTYAAGVSTYYDLGTHAGYDWSDYTVSLQGDCGSNTWAHGTLPQATQVCFHDTDLVLQLCL